MFVFVKIILKIIYIKIFMDELVIKSTDYTLYLKKKMC